MSKRSAIGEPSIRVLIKTRDGFSKRTIATVAKRAAFICSNPDCRANTLAPATADPSRFVYIGAVAHISGAAPGPGGARYRSELSSEQRRSIENAIFLCSSCATLIDKNGGVDFKELRLNGWKEEHECWILLNLNKRSGWAAGRGGNAAAIGRNSTAEGGRGGTSGPHGPGGAGGDARAEGEGSLAIGGAGGNAGSADGLGGRPARGPAERFGIRTEMWGFGRGGHGANAPEGDRRLILLQRICDEYRKKIPYDAAYINAGIMSVPVDWVNQRLAELKEKWAVSQGAEGFQLPPLLPGT